MSVARVTEVISSSDKSFDDAVQAGVSRAAETLQNITGCWVKDHKCTVTDGKITDWRVTMKITFILND